MVGVSIKASAGISNSDADPAVDGDSEAHSLDSGVHCRLDKNLGLRSRGESEELMVESMTVPLEKSISVNGVVKALVGGLTDDLEEFVVYGN